MTLAEEIARSQYVSLTTYRKDGTPVRTPVWQVPHEGRMWIVTEAKSHKVNRIRNNPQVQVVPCSVTGAIKPGAPTATGTAQVLDDAGTAKARELVARRYFLSRAGNFFARLLRLRRPPIIGIVVSF
jgi:uncharacterized protein